MGFLTENSDIRVIAHRRAVGLLSEKGMCTFECTHHSLLNHSTLTHCHGYLMRILFIIAVTIITIAGCSDPDSTGTGSIIPPIVQDSLAQLAGEWFWVQSTGGIAGTSSGPTASEQWTRLFTAESLCRISHNGAVVRSVKFSVGRGMSIYSPDSVGILRFTDAPDPEMILRLSADSLVLGDNYFDGFTSVYRRIGR